MKTNAEYHADTSHISKSGLDLIAKAPALYFDKYLATDRERTTTPTLEMGTMVHLLALEPHRFDHEYLIQPNLDRRTTAGKAAYAQFERMAESKKIISEQEYRTGIAARDAIMKHPAARELMLKFAGVNETTFTWVDMYTGAPCKCRPDRYLNDARAVLDVKTTQDASPIGFKKSLYKFRYHVQGAFYSDGVEAATGEGITDFIFIAVETERPYLVGVYRLNAEQLAEGRTLYRRDLETYMQCVRTGIWPGYSNYVETL